MHGNGPDVTHAAPPQNQQPDTQQYYAQHDFDGTATLTATLVHAISNVTGADVTEAEQTLSDHADPEALDRLFRPRPDGTFRLAGQLTFTIWGHHVTVSNDGQISIVPPQQQPPDRR